MNEDDKETWHHVMDWVIAAMFIAVLTMLFVGFFD